MDDLKNVIGLLQRHKQFMYEKFGVTRLGIFGSLVRGEFTPVSDIDIVVEMEESKKNIHVFFQLKRFLEKETSRSIDLGFEHALKPVVKKKIKKQIVYV